MSCFNTNDVVLFTVSFCAKDSVLRVNEIDPLRLPTERKLCPNSHRGIGGIAFPKEVRPCPVNTHIILATFHVRAYPKAAERC